MRLTASDIFFYDSYIIIIGIYGVIIDVYWSIVIGRMYEKEESGWAGMSYILRLFHVHYITDA